MNAVTLANIYTEISAAGRAARGNEERLQRCESALAYLLYENGMKMHDIAEYFGWKKNNETWRRIKNAPEQLPKSV